MASTLFNRPAASYADAKADKVTSAISGNFAALDANGNLTDSGHTSADYIPASQKGATSGVAELDSAGKVPSSQLPSYVDDVVEGYYYNGSFYEESTHTTVITPEDGKIYVDVSTNITYRWSGSTYVAIGSDLALGETSTTAYRGDRGAAAYAAAVTNVDSTPTASSTNLVTSGGVAAALPTTMTGASSSAAGAGGLVPAPSAGDDVKYLKGDGTWGTPPGTSYTLPLAADGTRGGIQVGYTTDGQKYPVELSNEKAYVEVPWTDHYDWDDITNKPSDYPGGCTGNAATATSAGKWTTARNFTIKDSDSTNAGTAVSVNGSDAVTLLLPSTIKASLTGNASTATSAGKWTTARNFTIKDSDSTNAGTAVSVNGSGAVTLLLPSTIKASITGNCSGSSGSCTGNAATATDADTVDGVHASGFVKTSTDQSVSGLKSFTTNGGICLKHNQSRYRIVSVKNNAGYLIGEYVCDAGDTSNITTPAFQFREYSGKSTADTTNTGHYEVYSLPSCTKALAANVAYTIWTTKQYPAPASGDTGKFLKGDKTWSVVAWSDVDSKPSSFTPASHTHGNITNAGCITTAITIAANDYLIIGDSSASGKLGKGPVFDASTATKCLTQKGTWETFGTSNLSIGTTSTTAMAGNTTVTNVSIGANVTTNASYPVVFATSTTSTTAAKTEALKKSGAKFYFNPSTGALTSTLVYNAVWNDYAEFRKAETIEPGRCITETSSGIMKLTEARLQAGCRLTSDTFGTCMGETDEAKTPIAVAGRVLVHPYRDRKAFHLGDAVCSAPGGTVDVMTREEIREYPERIVGTVSEIPDYDVWVAGSKDSPKEIQVNGRIWVYVR